MKQVSDEKVSSTLFTEESDIPLAVIASISRIDDKSMLAVASSDVEDRDGEVISMDGWDLKAFKQNPVLLWMHNRAAAHDGLPIGKADDIRVRTVNGRRLLTFRPVYDDSTEFNRAVKKMVESGLLNAFSVGFLPKDKDGNMYTKVELLEISQVPVPANAEATFIQRGKALGFSVDKLSEFIDEKAVVAYESYPPAMEGMEWDAAKAKDRVREWAGSDMSKYREAFCWYDLDKKDSSAAYKLPHHDIVDGKLVTVWRGVLAAMALIMGVKGKLSIPDEDIRGVYDHIAQHYKQFEREAPEFKDVDMQPMRELFAEIKRIERGKVMREVSQTLHEVKQMRRDMAKKTPITTIDSERVVALILKGIDANITPLLRGSASLRKGGLKQ